MSDLTQAKALLSTGKYTCVLYRAGSKRTSAMRGVRPLVEWKESGEDFVGFSAADKVVGKATAFLYLLLGVRAVYAGVMSKGALSVLQNAGVEAEYGVLVEHIINRAGDGVCPFEQAVSDISDPTAAYEVIRRKLFSFI